MVVEEKRRVLWAWIHCFYASSQQCEIAKGLGEEFAVRKMGEAVFLKSAVVFCLG